MNKTLYFATLITASIFAADHSKNTKQEQIEKFLQEHPEFRYQPRTARRVSLFEGVQMERFAEQELRANEELRASMAQLSLKKDNQG